MEKVIDSLANIALVGAALTGIATVTVLCIANPWLTLTIPAAAVVAWLI